MGASVRGQRERVSLLGRVEDSGRRKEEHSGASSFFETRGKAVHAVQLSTTLQSRSFVELCLKLSVLPGACVYSAACAPRRRRSRGGLRPALECKPVQDLGLLLSRLRILPLALLSAAVFLKLSSGWCMYSPKTASTVGRRVLVR